MTKYRIFILVYFLQCFLAMENNGQEAYFKASYRYQDTLPTVWKAMVYDGGEHIYVQGGAMVHGATYSTQGTYIIKLDTMGHIVKEKMIVDSTSVIFIGEKPQVSINSLGNLVFLYKKNVEYYFTEMTPELEVVRSEVIYFDDDINGYPFHTQNCLVLEDGYLISGIFIKTIINSSYDTFMIIKLDAQGKKQWIRYLDDYYRHWSYGLLKKETNRIFCKVQYISDPDSSYHTVYELYELDEKLDTISYVAIDRDTWNGMSFTNDFIFHNDTDYIELIRYNERDTSDLYYRQLPILRKMDRDMNEGWRFSYGIFNGSSFYPNQGRELNKLDDGHYLASGHILNHGRKTFHLKFSEDGEILWSRQDSVNTSEYTVYHQLNSTVVLPSGNIISIGESETFETGEQKGFIIKISKDGCVDESCSGRKLVSVKEVFPQQGLSVYPNPVIDELYFSYKGTASLIVEVYDMMGKLMLTQELEEKALDVSVLNAGVYVYKLKDSREVFIADGKFIKL